MRGGPLSPVPPTVLVDASTLRPPPTVVPDVRLLPFDVAKKELAGRGLRIKGRGEGVRVLAQNPVAGSPAERGDAVDVFLEPESNPKMPRVVGLTVRRALSLLSAKGIAPRIVGSGLVVSQTPAPGTRVTRPRSCVLRCRLARASYATAATGRGGRGAR